MRSPALIALLCCCVATVCAEDAQHQLDPANPTDAVQIVHILTEKISLPRDQATALTRSIETLAKLAQDHAKPAPAPAPVAPTVDPKAKP